MQAEGLHGLNVRIDRRHAVEYADAGDGGHVLLRPQLKGELASVRLVPDYLLRPQSDTLAGSCNEPSTARPRVGRLGQQVRTLRVGQVEGKVVLAVVRARLARGGVGDLLLVYLQGTTTDRQVYRTTGQTAEQGRQAAGESVLNASDRLPVIRCAAA